MTLNSKTVRLVPPSLSATLARDVRARTRRELHRTTCAARVVRGLSASASARRDDECGRRRDRDGARSQKNLKSSLHHRQSFPVTT